LETTIDTQAVGLLHHIEKGIVEGADSLRRGIGAVALCASGVRPGGEQSAAREQQGTALQTDAQGENGVLRGCA